MTTTFLPADAGHDGGPWYTHRWPWLVMSGPAAVVVAASFSGWLAFSRQDQMVVDDYYNQGLLINQDIRRDTAASALGLAFHGHYNPATERFDGTLTSLGRPIGGTVQIGLRHATDPRKDRNVLARVSPNGSFSVLLPLLEKSRWSVVLIDQRRSWQLAGIWQWPQTGDVTLRADVPAAKKR